MNTEFAPLFKLSRAERLQLVEDLWVQEDVELPDLTSDADDDVAASYDWYERREPGLGEEFLWSIEACLRGIQRHPEMYLTT